MAGITHLDGVSLEVDETPWDYAVRNAAKIARFWRRATAENPRLYNGAVYMMTRWRLAASRLDGVVQPTDFASFLYWRDQGFPETGARNCFGSSILRASEGHLLFGRMASHTATAGLVYPIGGSFGAEDVAQGRLDVETNISRELMEETGLEADEARRDAGYLCIEEGPRMSLGALFRFDLDSAALRRRIVSHLEESETPELDEIVVFRRSAYARHHRMPPFARMIVDHLLPH